MKWFGFRRTPLDAVRWVVIDCETSGLDPARDRLLSVGAVAVRGGRIALGEHFVAYVKQEVASAAENILVHGIGGDAQCGGRVPDEVIAELTAYVGEGVPVGFHAAFDAAILRRHGFRPAAGWIDLATLMPVLFPDKAPKQSSLDHWLAEFSIEPVQRHDALSDAIATAELHLVALAQLKRRGLDTVEALRRTERDARWLARH
jgi:DNA polymerase III subunit epsilon